MTDADDLLQRALTDAEASAAIALKVSELPLSDALTVIFHGRRDLGTLQTYVTNGGRGAGAAVGASELLRVPCDLDLADAATRDEAEELYAAQARALRDAIVAADNVLAVWAGPLAAATGGDVNVDRSIELDVRLPAHRLMPVALSAPERRLFVAAVCGARTLAEGRPPLASSAPSRTWRTSTSCPTTRRAVSRTSRSAPPSTPAAPRSGSTIRTRR